MSNNLPRSLFMMIILAEAFKDVGEATNSNLIMILVAHHELVAECMLTA